MKICNPKRRTYLHSAEITFADRMAAFCFCFFAVTGRKCGSNRGCAVFVCLNSCNVDISSHLMNHHLSWENLCEMDLILASAGLLELTDDLGPVARSLVSANRWLRGIKLYRFPWYLTLVSTNHASSNPGQIKNMTVCPVHRYTLGKYWQAPKTCQYPKHHGKKMATAGTRY